MAINNMVAMQHYIAQSRRRQRALKVRQSSESYDWVEKVTEGLLTDWQTDAIAAELDTLEEKILAAYEIYAGMEGVGSDSPEVKYLLRVIEQMASELNPKGGK